MAETIRESDKVKYISCDGLEETGLVEHGFMTRIGGISEGPYASLTLALGAVTMMKELRKISDLPQPALIRT